MTTSTAPKPIKIGEFKYFFPERPRLMHIEQPLFEQLSRDENWIAESKWNGKRLQLHHLPDRTFHFYNRHGQRMKYAPSEELLQVLQGLGLSGYWLFDGELRDGKVKGVRHKIILYDVFICDGHLMIGAPFRDRRGILDVLFHYRGPYSDTLDLPLWYETNFRQVFDNYKDHPEIEGLVLKNLDGQLNLGRTRAVESPWMWKVRHATNVVRF